MINIDYSKLEKRVVPTYVGELDARAKTTGFDQYTLAGADLHGIDPAQVTAEQRQEGKAHVCGLYYGMGPRQGTRLREFFGRRDDVQKHSGGGR